MPQKVGVVMLKIEEDLKTNINIINAILEVEDPMVLKGLQKGYGKTLTGKDPNRVVKSDKPVFNYAMEIMKFDILATKKYEDMEDEVKSFLQNTDLLNKIAIAYNVDIEVVKKAYFLPSKAEKIFSYVFGIDRNKYNIIDVMNILDIDEEDICNIISVNLRQLIKKISVEPKHIKSNLSNNNLPNYFLNPFIKKGYKHSEILNALSLYDVSVKKTLMKIYGKTLSSIQSSNVNILDEDIRIVNELLTGENSIENTISKMRESLILPEGENISSFNLRDYYCSLGFTQEEFLNCFFSLTIPEKNFIKKLFDNSFNVCIRIILNDDDKKLLYDLCFNEEKGIHKKLMEQRNKDFNKDYVPDIVKYYKNMGFSGDEIMNAFFKLNDAALNELKRVYNGNLQIHTSYLQSLATKRRIVSLITSPRNGFSSYLINNFDRNIKYNIKIDENDYIIDNVFSIYTYFGLKGVFSTIVEEAINLLDSETKKAYNSYFTSNGLLKDKCDNIEISKRELFIRIGNNINNIHDLRMDKKDKQNENTIGVCIRLLNSIGYDDKISLAIIKSLRKSEVDTLVKFVNYPTGKDHLRDSSEPIILKCILNGYILSNITNIKELFSYFGLSDSTLNNLDNLSGLLANIGEVKYANFLSNVLSGRISIDELDEEQTNLVVCLIKNISEYLILCESRSRTDSKINEYRALHEYFSKIVNQSIITPYRIINNFKRTENEYYFLMSLIKYNYLTTITLKFMSIQDLIYLNLLNSSFNTFMERYKKYTSYDEIARKLKKIRK